MNTLKKGLAALLCLPLLAGCAGQDHKTQEQEEIVYGKFDTVQEIEALSPLAGELTVWSVYWDNADDHDAVSDVAEDIDAVSIFAASFQDGKVVIPDAASRMMNKLRRRSSTKEKKIYLSVVNDVKNGSSEIQKDTEILNEVLGTDESAQAHAQELVKLAADNGYDGLEIDYEKIRDDIELWHHFLNFAEKLISLANDAGLSVRIILEPSTPADQLEFHDGAEYSVMCYNLFGGGTEPGPKADMEFLEQMYEKFHMIPNISYALANGGYIWEGDTKKATQCRADEAKAIADKTGVTPERDEASAALHFSYKEDGKKYTVWYADETTLAAWSQKLNELTGENTPISLWRL